MATAPKAKDDSLYLTDNGRVLCGRHLGASARWTLRDISGQRVLEVTPEVVAWARLDGTEELLVCEECGKTPS